MNDLVAKKCKPCEGGIDPLKDNEARKLLATLPDWELKGNIIAKTYSFKNYYQTMAFVNAVAWVSHQENHHPDLNVGFRECRVEYTTHAINGLSENDFICAAKVEQLFKI